MARGAHYLLATLLVLIAAAAVSPIVALAIAALPGRSGVALAWLTLAVSAGALVFVVWRWWSRG